MLTEVASERKFLRMLRYIHRIFGGLLAVLVVVMVVQSSVLTLFSVDGQSMNPTLHNKQIIPVLSLSILKKEIRRGDIVIVEYEGDRRVHFVKRVVAVPGEEVPFEGTIVTLEADQYFVVGDNRDFSTDSRMYGPIKKKQIVGLVLGNYMPGPAFP
jgi:signal peptidase I